MFSENLIAELSQKTPSRICLIVLDGLGGIPVDGKTELEVAKKPNLDEFAKNSVCGVSVPVALGISPGSGPGHLALFGYNPMTYIIGRGILEALGIGVEVGEFDLATRANFATQKNGIIVDRRAGRISTEENKRIVEILRQNIKEIDDVKVSIYPGKEHRFVVIFTGEDLSDNLTDADPQKEGLPPKEAQAKDSSAARSQRIVNAFIKKAKEVLKDEPKANTILLRGFSVPPNIPKMSHLYKLTCGAFATYPMYKGLARLVGMEIVECGSTLETQINTFKKQNKKFDFIFFHYKPTDSRGEDRDFEGKVKAIEEFDSVLPEILNENFDVVAITSDHSTPAKMGSHSWHPCPVAIRAKYEPKDEVSSFTEKEMRKGNLGRIWATDIMPILLANAGKLKKFGA
ncbi:MAG: 2,3-bisphosphoglycerate-independent phosphoglycerate mutase [Elusimicrobia bacterium]|nr:2,3-bisphosphoglycerate-independent phosphoglycerate mutase [Elusimicrobiota bacterium]